MGHSAQLLSPGAAYRPAAQAAHAPADDATGEERPAAQITQRACPAAAPRRPAAQSTHALAPTAPPESRPAAQGRHSACGALLAPATGVKRPSAQDAPPSHAVPPVVSERGMNLPAGQSLHTAGWPPTWPV